MKLKECLDNYCQWFRLQTTAKSFRVDEMLLKNFCLFMRNCEIEDISQQDIFDWVKLLETLEWKHNSIRAKLVKIRSFFTYFKKQGLEVLDPYLIPLPQHQYVQVHVATEEEFRQILEYYSRDIPRQNKARSVRNKAILWLLWDTGARVGEICSLNLKDLDLVDKTAVIQTEKAKSYRKPRQIFWSDEANAVLKKWIMARNSMEMVYKHPEALFLTLATSRTGDRMTELGVAQFLRTASRALKFKDIVNAHSFRHRLGHEIVKNGGTNSDVANILGHSSLISTYTYTQMSGKELQKRHQALTSKNRHAKL